MRRDPTNRVVDGAILVRSEVQDVDLARRFVQCQQPRVEAILNVQVRLPLPSIAEHAQQRGIPQKLLVKVGYVSVRVLLVQDRDEPEDPRAYRIGLAICRGHSFGG